MVSQGSRRSVHHSLYVVPYSHAAESIVTYVTRAGRNGLVWTNHVLSCDHASTPRNGYRANRPSGRCFLLRCLRFLKSLQVSVGMMMGVFKPAFPSVLPNFQNVLEGMIATKCSLGVVAPTYLEVRNHFLVGSALLSCVSRSGHAILTP